MPRPMDSPNLNSVGLNWDSSNSAWVVLTLTGELDLARTPDLDQVAADVLASAMVDAVVDLSGVTFMDSSALRWLLNFRDRLNRSSGRLRLAAPSGGSLERLLSLSGLEGQFTVFATVAEATGSFDPTVKALSTVASARGKPVGGGTKTV